MKKRIIIEKKFMILKKKKKSPKSMSVMQKIMKDKDKLG